MPAGWELLVDIVATLAGAFLLGAVMERFRQSAIVGYILAGVLIGPGLSGVVKNFDSVRALAELGVALLLFSIGLEFSWRQVTRLGAVVLGGGVVQILLTLGVGWGVALAFGVQPRAAIAVGAVLALSSSVVVMKVLKERGDLDALHGKAAVGILLVQDLALVPLVLALTLLGSEAPQAVGIRDLGPAIVQILAALLVFVLVLVAFLPRVMRSRALARNRELPILLAVTTCMGTAWVAHTVGVSPALGAFLGGIMLAETAYADQIRADVGPLRTLFATVFFASVGMLADVRWIGANVGAVLLLALTAVLGKTVLTFGAVRLFKFSTIAAISAGFALAQVGELSFVLLQVADDGGLLDARLSQLLTSASVLTLVFCPYLVGAAPRWGRSLAKRIVPARKLAHEERQELGRAKRLSGHVVVVGFGEAGRSAAAGLVELGLNVVVLETDRRLNQDIRDAGCQPMLGDGTQADILEHARLAAAVGLVVALSDHRSARLVVSQGRQLAPGIKIVARARYHLYRDEIAKAGADRVVDEESWVGYRLGEEMSLQLGEVWDHEGRDA